MTCIVVATKRQCNINIFTKDKNLIMERLEIPKEDHTIIGIPRITIWGPTYMLVSQEETTSRRERQVKIVDGA
jgi:hypothetical protein